MDVPSHTSKQPTNSSCSVLSIEGKVMNLSTIQTLAVSIITVVGLIVLIALKDLSSATGLPVIVAIAGVHLGSSLQTPAPVATSTTTVTTPPIQ
jgi:hypothetical protein